MRLAELLSLNVDPEIERALIGLPEGPADYRELACLLVGRWRARGDRCVGIGGGQGAGKSTLGRLIQAAGRSMGVRIEVLSLDDFYLPKLDREALAERVHPLLATRGPPGTHEIERLEATIRALEGTARVAIPEFDKGRDDRVADRLVEAPVDVVVLEGWCVGAPVRPFDESSEPINALERVDDVKGIWRDFVDRALVDHQRVYALLSDLVFLRVPGLDAVRRWRLQQEQERPPERRLTARDVDRFVEHYERITRRMLRGTEAGVTVTLADDHSVAELSFR